MVWTDISWSDIARCDVQYMTAQWFIDGHEVMPSDVGDLVSRMEAMCE